MSGSSSPVDEMLAALPEVQLRLWILADNGGDWYCVVSPYNSPFPQHYANAPTAAGALIGALQAAGIEVADDSP